MKRSRFKSLSGFTIIELIIVLGIISILMLVLVPAISGMIRDKQTESANKNSQMVFMAVQKYLNKCDYEHVDLTDVFYITSSANYDTTLTPPQWIVTVNFTKSDDTVLSGFLLDLSNVLSDEVNHSSWIAEIEEDTYRVKYVNWTQDNTIAFDNTNTSHFATINAQDAATKTNGYILGCYPIGT